ncbi:MAG: hypothetical protein ACLFQK_05180 [Fibrobacterota bacterium]
MINSEKASACCEAVVVLWIIICICFYIEKTAFIFGEFLDIRSACGNAAKDLSGEGDFKQEFPAEAEYRVHTAFDDVSGKTPMRLLRPIYGDPLGAESGSGPFGSLIKDLGLGDAAALGLRLDHRSLRIADVSLKRKLTLPGGSYETVLSEKFACMTDTWSCRTPDKIRKSMKGLVPGFGMLDPLFSTAEKFYNFIGKIAGKKFKVNPVRVNMDVP